MNGYIIVSALCAFYKFYQKCDIRITEVLADSKSAVCKHELVAALQVNLNCMSKDEHVPEIKWLICTTSKERCRCSFHNTPFAKLPRGLTIGLLKNVMFYLTAFPHKDGIPGNYLSTQLCKEKWLITTYIVQWHLEAMH